MTECEFPPSRLQGLKRALGEGSGCPEESPSLRQIMSCCHGCFLLLLLLAGLEGAQLGTATVPLSCNIVPTPQQVTHASDAAAASGVNGWPVGIDASSAPPGVQLAATMLLSRLTNKKDKEVATVPTAQLPKQSYIALGIPALDPVLGGFAAERNLSVPLNADVLGREGYLLDIDQHGVVLVANDERGVFYGVQSLLNLSQSFQPAGHAISWPAMSVLDFPSKPLRGADVENAPRLTDGGVEWMYQFLDLCATHKLNYVSYDASSSYWNAWSDCETSLESHGQDACSNLTAIVTYAHKRFIDIVPNINTIGSSGGVSQTIPNVGDGYWVRNFSFTFEAGGNETAQPDLPELTGPPNGDFTEMTGQLAPASWLVTGGHPGGGGLHEWQVVNPSSNCTHKGQPATCNTFWCTNRSNTACGRFMRANVTKAPCASEAPDPASGTVCTDRSAVLQSEPFAVESPTVLRLRFWTRVDSLGPNCTKEGPTVTATLTGIAAGKNYSVGTIELAPFERIIRAHENAVGDRKFPLHTWVEQTASFVTNQYVPPPPACIPIPPDGRCAPTQPSQATVVISSSVGGTCTASWSLGGIALERLDSALKNIIRTSATDIEVRPLLSDSQPGKLMQLGRDYEVVNASRNWAGATSFERLERYEIRRVEGGRLPKRSKIALSFDFLPGSTATDSKPDVATSLAEPLWYSTVEAAIINVTKRFKPRFLGLGFDEVRGAFRDSRTARSGKTNAELMAHAINELARMVQKHSPNTTAVFWADMINPYREPAPAPAPIASFSACDSAPHEPRLVMADCFD